jgi:hypothetical protein
MQADEDVGKVAQVTPVVVGELLSAAFGLKIKPNHFMQPKHSSSS